MTGCTIGDAFELVDQLPRVTRSDNGRYWRLQVGSHTFGYLWELEQMKQDSKQKLKDKIISKVSSIVSANQRMIDLIKKIKG